MRTLLMSVILLFSTYSAFANFQRQNQEATFENEVVTLATVAKDFFRQGQGIDNAYIFDSGQGIYRMSVYGLYQSILSENRDVSIVQASHTDRDTVLVQVKANSVPVLLSDGKRPFPLMAIDVLWDMTYMRTIAGGWKLHSFRYNSSVPAASPPKYNHKHALHYFGFSTSLCLKNSEEYQVRTVHSYVLEDDSLEAVTTCEKKYPGKGPTSTRQKVTLHWESGRWNFYAIEAAK